jgi:hypothetical protein
VIEVLSDVIGVRKEKDPKVEKLTNLTSPP